MRVIAGEAKGRVLRSPKGNATRPTTDRVKESVFAIISPFLPEAVVLDLFAGSGALAIEALSRGSERAVLVEKNRVASSCIQRNLEQTGFSERSEIMVMPVQRGIVSLARRGYQFDLVFMDPPYSQGHVGKTLDELAARDLVKSGGLVVVEHSSKEEFQSQLEKFAMRRQEVYGDTLVSFLICL